MASVPNGSFTSTVPTVDDDDEGLDLDVDSDDEGGEGEEDSAPAKRKRRCYIPKSNSAICSYLADILVKAKNKHPSIDFGTCWIPPRNPLRRSLGQTATPDEFYLSRAWVYLFLPDMQYQHLMPTKNKCPKCGGNNTKWTRYAYRPAHWFDKVVYVVHRRFECKHCKREWATINEEALNTLEPRIKDLFPFCFPTKYGPGVAKEMVHVNLCAKTKGIDGGTFAGFFNEAQRVDYAKLHNAYLDEALHWLSNPPLVVSSSIPDPFSPFDDHEGYCGVSLFKRTLNVSTRLFMAELESYMQHSHQLWNDNSASTDDSFKYQKHICANVGGTTIKPFGAVWTAMSGAGQPSISLWRFTKAADELEDVIKTWKKVRVNAGHPKLHKVERDNAANETATMQSYFPELTDDVSPFGDVLARRSSWDSISFDS